MPEHAGLQIADYLAVVGYLLVTMLIVYWSSRKQADTEDFFLGGRSMPWFAVGLSIMATLLSTNTYLGAPGEMIKYGPAYMLGYIAYPFLALVVMYLWIPFFMRLRMTSAYEYLEHRFDRRVRMVGNLLFLGLRLGWMAMVICTASLAMVRMCFGTEDLVVMHAVIVGVGMIATIYAFFGGMRAVIWTDVLQAFMLFGGVLLIVGFVFIEHGTGVGSWWNTIVERSPKRADVIVAGWDITERSTILWGCCATFFWNTCTHCSDQVALQRYFATTSLVAARRSFLVNIVSAMSIGLLLSAAGLALRYHYLLRPETLPDGLTPESGADQIMPHFYATALPAGFGGLVLVSFLCDAIQTLVSGVNSISATITTDVSARRGDTSGDMRVARGVVIAVGLVTTILAIVGASIMLGSKRTIFDMLPKMFNLFLGPLAATFMSGMFFRRARARTVLMAVAGTMLFSFCWSWWGEIAGWMQSLGLDNLAARWIDVFGTTLNAEKQTVPKVPTPLLAVAAPCIVGVTLGGLLSLFESREPHPGEDFTWSAMMKKPPL